MKKIKTNVMLTALITLACSSTSIIGMDDMEAAWMEYMNSAQNTCYATFKKKYWAQLKAQNQKQAPPPPTSTQNKPSQTAAEYLQELTQTKPGLSEFLKTHKDSNTLTQDQLKTLSNKLNKKQRERIQQTSDCEDTRAATLRKAFAGWKSMQDK